MEDGSGEEEDGEEEALAAAFGASALGASARAGAGTEPRQLDTGGLEPALLLVGFGRGEAARVRALADDLAPAFGGGGLRVLCASAPEALQASIGTAAGGGLEEPAWELPAVAEPRGPGSASASGLRCIVSAGLPEAACSLLLSVLEDEGLPPCAVALAHEADRDVRLGDLAAATMTAQQEALQRRESGRRELDTLFTDRLPDAASVVPEAFLAQRRAANAAANAAKAATPAAPAAAPRQEAGTPSSEAPAPEPAGVGPPQATAPAPPEAGDRGGSAARALAGQPLRLGRRSRAARHAAAATAEMSAEVPEAAAPAGAASPPEVEPEAARTPPMSFGPRPPPSQFGPQAPPPPGTGAGEADDADDALDAEELMASEEWRAAAPGAEVGADAERLRRRLEAEPEVTPTAEMGGAEGAPAGASGEGGFLNREVDITDPEALAEVLKPPPGFDPEMVSPELLAKHLEEEEGDERLREEAADTRAMLCVPRDELAALDSAFLERASRAAAAAAGGKRGGGESSPPKADAAEAEGGRASLREEPETGLKGFGLLDAALAAPNRPFGSDGAPSPELEPPATAEAPLEKDRDPTAWAGEEVGRARELSESEVRAILDARARAAAEAGADAEVAPFVVDPDAAGSTAVDEDDWLARFQERPLE